MAGNKRVVHEITRSVKTEITEEMTRDPPRPAGSVMSDPPRRASYVMRRVTRHGGWAQCRVEKADCFGRTEQISLGPP
jgi:hypothetical protein